MAEHFDWYDERPFAKRFSCKCGWKGGLDEMSSESFRELVDYSCPSCDKMLAIRSYPTADETRRAAARGNADAISALDSINRGSARWERAKAGQLNSVDQLPNLQLDGPTTFVWDDEEAEDEHWTLIRRAGTGEIVWRELEYWEGWELAQVVRGILAEAYGANFGGLVRTNRSALYLLGDYFSATDLSVASEAEAPWAAS